MVPTGMILIGSSAFSGLLAIFLFALVHHLSQKRHDISFFDDLSTERLHRIANHVRHIRVVRHKPKIPILNYHSNYQHKLSHVEIHAKDGTVSRIHPRNGFEKEILSNKLRILESKMSYHGLGNIISYN